MSHEQHFAQWLQDYETERIPDDMNIWNAIESQLKPVRRTTVFPRVGWLVAILMIILMTAGVYALDQIINNQVGDEGMNTVAEQGKVAQLFITNNFGGDYELQITLETIYADSNRVFVTMSASGTMPADNPISLHLNPHITLTDGTELPFLGFGGGGGGGGGGGDNTPARVPFSTSLTMNYDASVIENAPETLPLTITVELAYNTVANLQQDPMGMNMLGVTEFVVEVPFNKGITVNPNLSVTGENIEMTLKSAVIAPSLTRLELCYTEPSHLDTSETKWQPVMSLSVDDVAVIESQLVGQLPDTYNPETGCYTYILTFALDGYMGDWTLSIDRLVYQLTPPVDELQAAVDAAELPITAMPEGGFTVDSTDLSAEEVSALYDAIQQLIQENWAEKIEGTWTFTFTVPEA